jgi:hypothetical protein
LATIGISTTVAALGTRSVSAGSTGRSQASGLVVVIHCRRVRDSVRVEVNDHHRCKVRAAADEPHRLKVRVEVNDHHRCKVRAAANEPHRLEVRVVVPEHHKGKVKTDANAALGSAFGLIGPVIGKLAIRCD